MFHLGCRIPVQGRFFFRFLVLWGSTDAHYAPRGAGGVIGEENSAPCSEGVSWCGIFFALLGEICTGAPPPPATYQPRTSSARVGEASHCLVPKEDTDTAATADAKRMRCSGSASSPRRGCFEGLYERNIAPA